MAHLHLACVLTHGVILTCLLSALNRHFLRHVVIAPVLLSAVKRRCMLTHDVLTPLSIDLFALRSGCVSWTKVYC